MNQTISPKYNDKDRFSVTVNGIPVKTLIDESGVQRFVPDKLICNLYENGKIDLNRLELACENGLFERDELIKLYMGLGYSVDGFGDVFPELKIFNPVAGDIHLPPRDGYTIAFVFGKWGGFWWYPGYMKVMTLGWFSLMLIPRDLQMLVGELTQKIKAGHGFSKISR